MNEPVPKSLEKMEGAKSELCLSEEETSDYDFSDFKTPLHPSSVHKSRQSWTQNTCDSGFGSAQRVFSDSSSSVGSSIRSSPESSTSSSCGRRVTVGTCDFSPLTRELSSVIQSRKLDFHSVDLLPISSRLQFVDEDVRSQESFLSEDFEMQEKGECDEDGRVENTNNSLSPVCPGLFSFENDAVSFQRKTKSVSYEDLDLNLQDMSLEESASSSSSLSSHSGSAIPSRHIKLKKGLLHMNEEAISSMSCSSSEADEAPVKIHILDWVAHVSKTPESNKQKNMGSPSKSSLKTNFLTALHLTSAHTITNDVITPSTHSVLSLPSNLHNNQAISGTFLETPTHTCHQPQIVLSESSSVKSQLCSGSPSSFLKESHLCKSPCKRTGADELHIDHTLSPTKSRKTESCQEQSPIKYAARNIFQEDSLLKHSSVEKFDRLQSNLRFSLDHSIGTTSSHKTSFCECSEKAHPNSNRQAEHFCIIPDTPSHSNSISKSLHSVIQMALPLEPSRLIGRNVGVAKLDIIKSLYKNFNLCVAEILSSLRAEDLISVFMVSRAWREALENDTASFIRYKHHLCDVAKKLAMSVCSGKENAVEKVIDKPKLSKPMTESKGCFSSLQFQASPKAAQQLPQKPECKSSTGPAVQWGDELRHCPSCQHQALVRPQQGRAVCMDPSCGYDFCTQCFAAYHHPKPCKPLNRSVSKKDVAGSLKSKKSLKRL